LLGYGICIFYELAGARSLFGEGGSVAGPERGPWRGPVASVVSSGPSEDGYKEEGRSEDVIRGRGALENFPVSHLTVARRLDGTPLNVLWYSLSINVVTTYFSGSRDVDCESDIPR
jgi:hypothetical protein